MKKQGHATFSHQPPKPPSWRDKVKGFFRKDKNEEELINSRITVQSSTIASNDISFLSQSSME